ncbi:MAG: hypothetical protein KJ077_11205 [Anaerolineae bacterium]|nr:hypothetical protein [Anaerolineae bacterium]
MKYLRLLCRRLGREPANIWEALLVAALAVAGLLLVLYFFQEEIAHVLP